MDSRLLLAVSVLCGLQVDSQTFPYVFFMGSRMPNHSYVNIDLSDIVKCHTNLTSDDNPDGNWYFHDGEVTNNEETNIITYGQQSVDLHFHDAMQSGIYHCTIRVHDGADSSVRATVYVGIYGSAGK